MQALTEHEVARELKLSVKTLQAWRNRKVGPPYRKLGRCVRYFRADLDRWLETETFRK